MNAGRAADSNASFDLNCAQTPARIYTEFYTPQGRRDGGRGEYGEMDDFGDGTSPSSGNAVVRKTRHSAGCLPCTQGRVLSVENLDAVEGVEAEKNLRDIARINRWFGGHRTLVGLLRRFVGPDDRFSMLDVGAASGDMGRCVQKRFRHARVVSLDRRPLHLKAAPTPRIAADALALPFADASFDLVMCSSLLHHFSSNEAATLLRGMRRIARRAVIVLDIERHLLAYFLLPFTRPLLRWSALSVHDGCASVEAAFRRSELESLAQSVATGKVVVQRHRPWFRLSMLLAAGPIGSERHGRRSESDHSSNLT